MERPDFSEPTITVTLPQKVIFTDPKTKNKIKVASVELQRLLAPALSRLKKALASIPKSMEQSTYYFYMYNMLKETCKSFFDDDGNELKVQKEYVLNKMPVGSGFKLLLYSVMLLKEASFTTTAYRCQRCNKTNLFDLDPTQPVPDEIEPGRRFMEDLLDFCTETYDLEDKETFIVTLTKNKPKIKVADKVSDVKVAYNREEAIEIIEFEYPTIGNMYLASQQVDSDLTVDMLALYYSIRTINNYTQKETQELKKFNSPSNVLNFHIDDFSVINTELSKYGVDVNHFFECEFCGYHNDEPFDFTNFFAFQRN